MEENPAGTGIFPATTSALQPFSLQPQTASALPAVHMAAGPFHSTWMFCTWTGGLRAAGKQHVWV